MAGQPRGGGRVIEPAEDYVRRLAREAAQARLERAAIFAEMHCIPKPMWKRWFRWGRTPRIRVQFDWPGILRVFDAATGELLAESRPGAPRELSPKFIPSE